MILKNRAFKALKKENFNSLFQIHSQDIIALFPSFSRWIQQIIH